MEGYKPICILHLSHIWWWWVEDLDFGRLGLGLVNHQKWCTHWFPYHIHLQIFIFKYLEGTEFFQCVICFGCTHWCE